MSNDAQTPEVPDGTGQTLSETSGVSPVHRWRPYPAYKDSGAPWLGEIPAHWDVKRLKYAAILNPSRSEMKGILEGRDVTFLPMERIGEEGSLQFDLTKRWGQDDAGFTYFRDGDVILAKITPCFENGKGAICWGLTAGIGLGTTELHVLRARENMDANFLLYLTRSPSFRRPGASFMQGTAGQKRVTEDFVRDFATGIPALPEQRAIAAFLDRETAHIDALLAKKERLLELLAEKRTALISHAVTRGLDASAPLKESGVPWLGKIPKHWVIKRLRHLSPRLSVGVVVNPSSYFAEQGVPFLLGNNVSAGRISTEGAKVITEESNHSLSQSILRTGDLVVVRVGYPGTAAVVPPSLEGANCASMMIVRRSSKFVSQWLCYALNSQVGRDQFEVVLYGAAQRQFNISDALDFVFALPPSSEQHAIADFLDRETAKLDALAAKVREGMERLREYRAALIAAAVTGKVDVRGSQRIETN